MTVNVNALGEVDLFTFQSGSIQILSGTGAAPWYLTLHSNLVLFKSIKHSCSHFHCKVFTFQSGSIQIKQGGIYMLPFSSLHSNLVLFKWKEAGKNDPYDFLYIPIWFYSNKSDSRANDDDVSLYIPIWFYSNPVNFQTQKRLNVFTFQSGSIQMIISGGKTEIFRALHSNLVLFKCYRCISQSFN